MKKIGILLAVATLAACTPKLAKPTQADADRGASKYPGLTLAELAQGRELNLEYCGACHDVPSPTSHKADQWEMIVPAMAEKCNQKAKTEIVDSKEKDILLKYFVTLAGN